MLVKFFRLPILHTSHITTPISIITLSVLLSLCVRSTLSIPLLLSPRDGQGTSITINGPVPSPSDPSVLQIVMGPPKGGCRENDVLILKKSLALASKWAKDAYEAIERYEPNADNPQEFEKFLSPDGTTPDSRLRPIFTQLFPPIKFAPHRIDGTIRKSTIEAYSRLYNFFSLYAPLKELVHPNDIKKDAKTYLRDLSISLGAELKRINVYPETVESEGYSGPFVFACFFDEKAAENMKIGSNPHAPTITTKHSMSLFSPFFKSTYTKWREGHQTDTLNEAAEKSIRDVIEEDIKGYRAAKLNGKDAHFPLPVNPVYTLLRSAEKSHNLLQTYRETDNLEDLRQNTQHETDTTTNPIVNPEVIAPEERSRNAENWALVAWLNYMGNKESIDDSV